MAIQYTLRGKQHDQPIEREGTLTEEQLVGIKDNRDTATINIAIRELHRQGTSAEWEECTLKDTSTQNEEIYIRYKKRWTNRSKIRSHQ